MPTMAMPTAHVTKPTRIRASGAENTLITTTQNTAHQNVRNCQPKWLSSQVPRTSPRFT